MVTKSPPISVADGLAAPIPHDEAAERALLGALLIDPEAIDKIGTAVVADDFYSQRHRTVFAALRSISDAGAHIDFVTVVAHLSREHQLDQLGGAAYLTALINAAPSSLHADSYAGIVADLARRRRLQLAGVAIASGNVDLSEATELVEATDAGRTQVGIIQIETALDSYLADVAEKAVSDERSTAAGIATGFADLDRLTCGLHPGELVILAARTSVGKSAFAVSLARNVAVAGHGVALFSLEMDVHAIVERMLSAEARVDAQRLRQGYVDEYEWRRISEAFGVLSPLPIWFDPTPSLTFAALRSKVRRLNADHPLGIVIVDYLQLMSAPIERGGNREQAVAGLTRSLKALARELSIPVVALSQLNRAVEGRQDHRPQLSDLRESGAIEQDADVVLFLHREEMYNPNTDRRNIADLIVAKQRSGPKGTIPLRFWPSFVSFADLEMYRRD